ncbi:hypothetical protein [Oceanobacillus chungangensis]|uniref:Lipoprotein n=1 Tax=Oceanobacillus chungangensis TaxID=1229152 RepID=A0A3D8PQ41_9BACI|nr:hypothetical protein [Oceanobacillus chungangensis]RDW17667.1 hypothetical protein CWR45_09990 [Oceanobacillus chungangensis]
MIKNYFMFSTILFFFLVLSSGCTNSSDNKVTISVNSDSEYVNTFEDLNLGILYDFDFKLPNADKSWVNLWVERYYYGKRESKPLTQLSYGNSPNEVDEGHLGFGMINPNSEDTLVFVYGPDVSTQPSIIEYESKTDIFSSWDYAIGNEEVELELGETKILAVYRETEGNSISTIDLQDEESVNRMIKEDAMVLLLKIKIEEKNANQN